MEIREYIESGIIESYLLGLASPQEEAELKQLRRVFPELNSEIAIAELRFEKLAFQDAVMPPEKTWDGIQQRICWEDEFKRKTNNPAEKANYTFINMQPRQDSLITVHKNWKYAFIVIFILSKLLLIGAIILGVKYYQELKEHGAQQPKPTQIENRR